MDVPGEDLGTLEGNRRLSAALIHIKRRVMPKCGEVDRAALEIIERRMLDAGVRAQRAFEELRSANLGFMVWLHKAHPARERPPWMADLIESMEDPEAVELRIRGLQQDPKTRVDLEAMLAAFFEEVDRQRRAEDPT